MFAEQAEGLQEWNEATRLYWVALIEHSAGNTETSNTALLEFEKKYGEKSPVTDSGPPAKIMPRGLN